MSLETVKQTLEGIYKQDEITSHDIADVLAELKSEIEKAEEARKEATKTNGTDILHHVFGWGWMDVDFVCNLADDFRIELGDIDLSEWSTDQIADSQGINILINEMFEQALNRAGFDWNEHDGKMSIYTNCLDSHLYIDGEEIYDYEELQEAVAKLGRAEDAEV